MLIEIDVDYYNNLIIENSDLKRECEELKEEKARLEESYDRLEKLNDEYKYQLVQVWGSYPRDCTTDSYVLKIDTCDILSKSKEELLEVIVDKVRKMIYKED